MGSRIEKLDFNAYCHPIVSRLSVNVHVLKANSAKMRLHLGD